MANVGYSTTVKVSGTAVPVTGEACAFSSGAGASQVFQVTNSARRIWDPTVAVIVKDGVTVLTPGTQYTFDYLFGKIQFVAYTPVGAIAVDGSYLPTNAIAEARKLSFVQSRDLFDRTTFDSAGVRQRVALLQTVKGNLRGLALITDDLDAGVGGIQSLESFFTAGGAKLLEFRLGGVGNFFRAWVLFSGLMEDVPFDQVLEAGIDFEGTVFGVTGQNRGAAAGWGT